MMRKIYRIWQNQRIQTKLTEAILIAGMVPVIIMLVMFGNRLYELVIADTIRSEQDAPADMEPLISEQLDRIDEAVELIREEELYIDLFEMPVEESLESLAASDAAADFLKQIRQLTASGPVRTVKIYATLPEEGLYSLNEDNPVFCREAEIAGTYWHGIFDGTGCSELYCPAFYLSSRECSSYGDCAYIIKRNIDYAGEKIPAYIAFYYSSDIFTDIMREGMSVENSVTFIINDRNAVVAATDLSTYGLYNIRYSDIEASLLDSSSFVEKEITGNRVYVAFNHIKEPDWYLVTVIPRDPVIASAQRMVRQFLIIVVLSVALALLLAVGLAASITSRLGTVERQMRRATMSPPVALPEPEISDEVGGLISSYNYMTEQINGLLEEQEKNAEELRIAEFNSLQAQINPHFLYNTLDMINWMAVQGKTEEVSDTVQDLAKFYRLTLSRKKRYSTISDELEHASVYMQLQNRRFADTIELIVDVPDELTMYRIPRLTLQPILENSIIHGILEKEDKTGTIVITAWDEEDDILILISDDGIGMDQELAANILSPDREPKSGGTNIAVINVHRRLQLLYGDAYGLNYSSIKGQGCDVTIRIPKHLGDSIYVRK